jgi:hypothetical protein
VEEGVGVVEMVGVAEGVVEGVGVRDGDGVLEAVGVWEGVRVEVRVGVGVLLGEGEKFRLVESMLTMGRLYCFAHTCRVASGMLWSFTRMEYFARMAGETVEGRSRAPAEEEEEEEASRRRTEPAAQLPWFSGSVAATSYVVLLASVQETRRTWDADAPVALARAQRTSVTLVSVRTVLPASKTTVRTDARRGPAAVSVSPGLEAPSPRPRPRPSAATARKARKRAKMKRGRDDFRRSATSPSRAERSRARRTNCG